MELVIYVRDNCFESGKALDVASWVKRINPNVKLRVVNMDRKEDDFKSGLPEVTLYQGPIYIFNDEVVQMGNSDGGRLIEFFKDFEKEHLN